MDIPKHSAWGHRVGTLGRAQTGAIMLWTYSGRGVELELAVW